MSSGFFEFPSGRKNKAKSLGFAVVDIETSGLNAAGNRILEVAVVLLDNNLEFIDEIATLINPGSGDLGPVHLHHINVTSLENAPDFQEFSQLLKSFFNERIVVAHNAKFEDAFFSSEFSRFENPRFELPCIDTLKLSREFIDAPNHKLGTLLELFDIKIEDTHTALGDARGLADLLPKLLELSGIPSFNAPTRKFEEITYEGRLRTRATNLNKGKDGWIANIIRKLPYSGLPILDSVAEQYLELLDIFLSDGKVTEVEARDLLKVAGDAGLGSGQLQEIHRDYFSRLEKAALSDGILTDTEYEQLEKVRNLLHLS